MPSVGLFNRRWRFATDDLAVPSVCTSVLRIFWLVCLSVAVSHASTALRGCDEGWLILAYIWLAIVCCAVSIVLHAAISYLSTLGSPTDESQRSAIPSLLILHIVVVCVEFVIVCFGMNLLVGGAAPCWEELDGIETMDWVLPTVVISQLVDLFASACCMCCLLGGRPEDFIQSARRDTVVREEVWETRCQLFCKCTQLCTCNLFGGGAAGNFDQVARVLAKIFHAEGKIDLVPSDVAAGIVLLRHTQNAKDSAEKFEHSSRDFSREEEDTFSDMHPSVRSRSKFYRVASRLGHVLDRDNREHAAHLHEAAHFCQYAVAIYTWMLHVFMHPVTGPFTLLNCCAHENCSMSKCSRRRRNTDDAMYNDRDWPGMSYTIGDGMCLQHERALLAASHLTSASDLIYAHFTNTIVETPYCILIDRHYQSIVIAIRGTLSLEDCITDAIAEPESLEAVGEKWGFDGTGGAAHGGILERARWLRQDLDRHQLLHVLMEGGVGAHEMETIDTPLANSCSGYSLRILGHSLGAGVAALLTMMLRDEFPMARCLCYSPPGGMLTLDHARETCAYTDTFIVGKDIVPRLSQTSMEALRNVVLENVAKCKANKLTVMRSMLKKDPDERRSLMHDDADVPHSPFLAQLNEYKDFLADEAERHPTVQMYPPGRIVHLVKTDGVKTCIGCCKKRVYTPVFAGTTEFKEIQISPTMMIEHFPDRVAAALQDASAEFGNELSFPRAAQGCACCC